MTREVSAATSAGFEALCHLGVIADLGDGRLIERFLAAEGQARELAFRALVDRHGPMVVRACRSVLRDEHEAQDVAQEVFLTLARRAMSLRRREAIGPWLHRVSLRAALRARRGAARRACVGVAPPETIPADAGAGTYDDASEILHQEIDRLPRRSREAVVACDLEGLTYAAAAARLGLPVRTFQSRLHRGRARLKLALIRRGVGLGLADLALRSRAEAAWTEGLARGAGRAIDLPSAVAWPARCAAALVAGTIAAVAGVTAVAPASRSAVQESKQEPKPAAPAPATAALLAPLDRDEARRVLREAASDVLAVARDAGWIDGLAIDAVAAAQAKADDPDGARGTLEAAEKVLLDAQPERKPSGIQDARDFGAFVRLARTAQNAGFAGLSRRLIDEAVAALRPEPEGLGFGLLTPDDVVQGAGRGPLVWRSSLPLPDLLHAVCLLRRQGRLEQAALLARGAQRAVVVQRPVPRLKERDLTRANLDRRLRVASIALIAGVHRDLDEAIREGALLPVDRSNLVQRLLLDSQELDDEGARRILSIVQQEAAGPASIRPKLFLMAYLLVATGQTDELGRLLRGQAEGEDAPPARTAIGIEASAQVLARAAQLRANAGDLAGALATLRMAAEGDPGRPARGLSSRTIESIAERQAELGDCDDAAATLATIPEGDRTPTVLLKLARGYAIDGREGRASEFLALAHAHWREPPADVEKALFADPSATRASLDVVVPQLAYLDRVDESVALVRRLPDEQERQAAYGGVVQIQAERGAFARALRLARAGELRVRPTLPYKYLANGVRWRLEAEARVKAARRVPAR